MNLNSDYLKLTGEILKIFDREIVDAMPGYPEMDNAVDHSVK